MNKFKEKKPDIELIYRTADNLNLPMHVFLPNSVIHKAQTILFIHGGGWNDAIKDNKPWNGGWMSNNAKYFSEKGFIGIVISYRSLTVSKSINVGHLLEDCIDAIGYIKEHLKFVDFDNIIYAGDSAGGYLATMLGLSQNDNIRPQKVIALNPVLAVQNSKWSYGFKNCIDIDKLTPSMIIDEKCADFLFLHGTSDDIVSIEHTEELHNKLLKYQHSSKFIKVPDAVHAFGLFDYKYSDDFVCNIMEKIIGFIEARQESEM